MFILLPLLATLSLTASAFAYTTDSTITKITTADSAVITSPGYRAVLTGSMVKLTVEPKCPVAGGFLFATRYPDVTDTLTRISSPPFSAIWDVSAIPDQDQFSLRFGYALFHENGDTIVAPRLNHRWVLDRNDRISAKRLTCRQLHPKREITVDGDDSDWHGIRRAGVSGRAAFACTWTPVAFYVFVNVYDIETTAWDRVELHFDLYNDKASLAGAQHRLISIGPKSRSFSAAVALADSGPSRMDSIAARIADEMEYRPSARRGGYALEVRVPFIVLADLDFPPPRMGFDLAVLDRASGAASPLEVVTWSGAPASARHNPSEWGTVILRQALLPLKAALLVLFGVLVLVIGAILFGIARQKNRERYYRLLDERPVSPRVRRVLDCITTHCHTPGFSLERAAGMLDMPAPDLAAALKTDLAASFGNLLSMARTRRAKDLLRSTDEPVESIARKCGFERADSFVAMFKRVAGTAPDRYRTQQREKAMEDAEEEDDT
ncbi:MAG: helix-turn-helix domain-containing protein [Chitinivibrionales bacterium]|nr:helix-turn-helix domain-containing protein [Chitinivibrionales bacterium]MBD3396244.1 helix-turn-helix domain-containing protein [Chitinivibrionales bacterium]